MKDSVNLDRRKVLGTVGGLAAAGSGLAAFSGSAAATVNTSFTANNTDTLTTADGSVRKVVVETDGTYSWKGLDSPAKTATVTLEAKKEGGSYMQVTSKSYRCNGLSGKKDFELDTVDLTEKFSDDHFESDSDGKLKETDIDLKISVTITSADGSTNGANASDSMTVSAENRAADANIDGESNASASSYDQVYSFDAGGHPNLDSDGNDHDGDSEDADTYLASNVLGKPLRVEVWHDDPIVYQFRLPAAFTTGSQDNLGVFLDVNDSGTGNYQAIYHASNGVSYQKNESGWTDVSSVPGLDISIDSAMETVTLAIDPSLVDSTYRIGFRLGYAGGSASGYDTLANWYPSGTNFALYNVPRSDFRDDSDGYFGADWTSSEHYMTQS
ncbi:hypothetical protein [Halorussus halophilus]|uniref:hypothetical protein n=1 Tax=Halorussus halophilus TaxID=2650975 RepID=UPI001300CC74|nr:hypothetical protein [Halorussus halophilus]